MARYIDEEKLEEWVREVHPADAYWAISMLKNAPTADVAEVNHGCWMYGETENIHTIEIYCPWCGKPALYPEEDDRPEETEFCPHCGAIMDAPCADPSWPYYNASLKTTLKNQKE